MPITEEGRHQLYQKLETVLGRAEATTLMEHLPPVGWADVATKRDIDGLAVATKRDIEGLAADIEALAAATNRDIDGLAAATKRDIDGLAAATKRDLDGLAAAMKRDLESLEERFGLKLDALEHRMGQALHSEIGALKGTMLAWALASNATIAAAVIAAAKLL